MPKYEVIDFDGHIACVRNNLRSEPTKMCNYCLSVLRQLIL